TERERADAAFVAERRAQRPKEFERRCCFGPQGRVISCEESRQPEDQAYVPIFAKRRIARSFDGRCRTRFASAYFGKLAIQRLLPFVHDRRVHVVVELIAAPRGLAQGTEDPRLRRC